MRTPSLTLLAAGAAILVFGVIRILKTVVSKGKLDVGSVSDRWIAEHRAGSGDETR
jgi:hypothetical protein